MGPDRSYSYSNKSSNTYFIKATISSGINIPEDEIFGIIFFIITFIGSLNLYFISIVLLIGRIIIISLLLKIKIDTSFNI